MEEYSECWMCKHYNIGGNDLDDFLSGFEECELGLCMHSNKCDKYKYERLNNYDEIDIDNDMDEIPF